MPRRLSPSDQTIQRTSISFQTLNDSNYLFIYESFDLFFFNLRNWYSMELNTYLIIFVSSNYWKENTLIVLVIFIKLSIACHLFFFFEKATANICLLFHDFSLTSPTLVKLIQDI